MTVPHYGIEIALTRSAEQAELARARRALPLAVNTDRTRLLALVQVKNERRAFQRIRNRVGELLPIDVLTTHYPDVHGRIQLNLVLPHGTEDWLRRAASLQNLSPAAYLTQTIRDAVAQEEERHARHLESALEPLLSRHTPEAILLAAARTLTRHRQYPEPASDTVLRN